MDIQKTIDFINKFYAEEYSKTARVSMKGVGHELIQYLAINGLPFSEGNAQDWLTLKMKQNEGRYLQIIRYHHAVNLIIEVSKTGEIAYGKVFNLLRKSPRPAGHEWQIILDGYLAELSMEAKAASTIRFSDRACTKFIMFLELHGCMHPNQLTPGLCRRYESETGDHSTHNGKRAYQYKIRLFIRYLERKGLVARTMEYAIKTRYRIPQRMVTILSEDQKREVCSARGTVDAVLNRTYAMATLALYLGLRSVDILNLRFSDIDWIANTVRVVQQKTMRELTLPLIAAVGNAIADYVLHHRPGSDPTHIFVSHRRPYGRLTSRSSCYSYTLELVRNRPDGQPAGMHIMRRTLASDLLRNHTRHDLVSSFLGHASAVSIEPYLNTDSERMRRCSLALGEVGLPEVFR
jgi:integrase